MVVGNLLVINHRAGVHGNRNLDEWQFRSGQVYELRQSFGHVLGQETRVRPRVGDKLLLIQALRVIQRLLGGEPEKPVGFALERGEIVELRRRGS